MKTEELSYQIIEARDMHLHDVSTHLKVKGGEMRKQVSMCYSSLHTCDPATYLHRFAHAYITHILVSKQLTFP